jgi:hypothetical protein
MKSLYLGAALAAALCGLSSAVDAGCIIAPDGKSIDVVTDNGSSDAKSCSVRCKVDTKIGVVQVSCGGTTPPLAKGHSLCDYDKPEPYYKKVVSSEDSCKGSAQNEQPAAPKAAAVKPGTFICRIAPDGHSFDAMIANPYKADASCNVNCQISTTIAGTTEQSSCAKTVAAGAGEVVLCTHTIDKGHFVKVVGGSGSCTDPTPTETKTETKTDTKTESDDDKDAEALMQRMQRMPKPPTTAKSDDADMQAIVNDPDKMRDYMRKQLPPEAQKMFDDMNKK